MLFACVQDPQNYHQLHSISSLFYTVRITIEIVYHRVLLESTCRCSLLFAKGTWGKARQPDKNAENSTIVSVYHDLEFLRHQLGHSTQEARKQRGSQRSSKTEKIKEKDRGGARQPKTFRVVVLDTIFIGQPGFLLRSRKRSLLGSVQGNVFAPNSP